MSRASWIRFAIIAILVLAVLLAIRLHVAASQGVTQDTGGNASSGRRLAEAWCTECHAIDARAAQRSRTGPAFTEVANRPSTTALSLNTFLRSVHRTMPNFIIERGDADDLVAYILSLKRRG
jgi:cytochrome c2